MVGAVVGPLQTSKLFPVKIIDRGYRHRLSFSDFKAIALIVVLYEVDVICLATRLVMPLHNDNGIVRLAS